MPELEIGTKGIALENIGVAEKGWVFFYGVGKREVSTLEDVRAHREVIVVDEQARIVEYGIITINDLFQRGEPIHLFSGTVSNPTTTTDLIRYTVPKETVLIIAGYGGITSASWGMYLKIDADNKTLVGAAANNADRTDFAKVPMIAIENQVVAVRPVADLAVNAWAWVHGVLLFGKALAGASEPDPASTAKLSGVSGKIAALRLGVKRRALRGTYG